jgi:hypothetical protein
MHSIKPRLQLSLCPELIPPAPVPAPGETITTASGSATVTRTEPAGREQIIFASYGFGEQPHIQESLLPTEPPPPKRPRRHSPKGKASGTIKPRIGNTQRHSPTTSYYYEWTEGGKKRSTYIPKRQVATITEMIDRRCSVDEILTAITKREKHD